MLISLLLSDLERYFHYNGQVGRVPRKRDLWRNFIIPRCAPVAIYRIASTLHRNDQRSIAKLVTWINFYLHGLEISANTEIGPHLYMPHASGSVIGAQKIGKNAVIYHQVTIGAKVIDYGYTGRPTIGDNVVIGAGAKILGHIKVGDRCQVGANSVVLKSCGDGQLLIGIPARPETRLAKEA